MVSEFWKLAVCAAAVCGAVAAGGLPAQALSPPPTPAVPVSPGQLVPAPGIQARSAVVIDGEDGTILFAKNPHMRLAPASTTKILTALVVLENAKPQDVVVVPALAERVGGNDPYVEKVGLKSGERVTVEKLLHAMLLSSANDAAVALAVHVGGTVNGFARLANARVLQAGAKDTHMVNPHGLDTPRHFSSAYDLAVISRAARRIPLFRQIVATQSYQMERRGYESQVIENRNPLLARYGGVDGVKTGYTAAAGRCLVASASRPGETRISVVLDSPDTAGESTALLDYGFNAFAASRVVARGEYVGWMTLGSGATVQLFAKRGYYGLAPRGFVAARRITKRGAGARMHLFLWNATVVTVDLSSRVPPKIGAANRSDSAVAQTVGSAMRFVASVVGGGSVLKCPGCPTKCCSRPRNSARGSRNLGPSWPASSPAATPLSSEF